MSRGFYQLNKVEYFGLWNELSEQEYALDQAYEIMLDLCEKNYDRAIKKEEYSPPLKFILKAHSLPFYWYQQFEKSLQITDPDLRVCVLKEIINKISRRS